MCIQVLLGALQKCLAFEREAEKRFTRINGHNNVNSPMVTDIGGSSMVDSNEDSSTPGVVDIDTTTSPTAADHPLFSELSVMSEDSKEREEGRTEKVLMHIIGSISGVFDPFMDPYIDFERQKVRRAPHLPITTMDGPFLILLCDYLLFIMLQSLMSC